MKNLFLCSSFAEVASLYPACYGSSCEGKRAVFIPTASLPEEITHYVDKGREALQGLGFVVDELDISQADTETIATYLSESDLIYVSGGNTFFLLQTLRNGGADCLLRESVVAGKPYIGESAGAIVTAPDIAYVSKMDDRAAAKALESSAGLELIDFYPLPHFGNPPFAEVAEAIYHEFSEELNITTLSNSEAIWLGNGQMKKLSV